MSDQQPHRHRDRGRPDRVGDSPTERRGTGKPAKKPSARAGDPHPYSSDSEHNRRGRVQQLIGHRRQHSQPDSDPQPTVNPPTFRVGLVVAVRETADHKRRPQHPPGDYTHLEQRKRERGMRRLHHDETARHGKGQQTRPPVRRGRTRARWVQPHRDSAHTSSDNRHRQHPFDALHNVGGNTEQFRHRPTHRLEPVEQDPAERPEVTGLPELAGFGDCHNYRLPQIPTRLGGTLPHPIDLVAVGDRRTNQRNPGHRCGYPPDGPPPTQLLTRTLLHRSATVLGCGHSGDGRPSLPNRPSQRRPGTDAWARRGRHRRATDGHTHRTPSGVGSGPQQVIVSSVPIAQLWAVLAETAL